MWPKKVKECSVLAVCTCFPLWAVDDSHSDIRVAGMEDVIALAAEHQPHSSLGLFAFLLHVQ